MPKQLNRSGSPQPNTSKQRSKRSLALTAVFIVVLVWGYNWVVMKKVLAYTGPLSFTSLRTAIGALALVLLMIWRREYGAVPKKAWPRILILGLLQTTAFSLLIQLALLEGEAGKSSILTYTMPFWVVPMAWWAFDERIQGWQWLALMMAAIGLVLILQPWGGQHRWFSEAYALAAGLTWALAALMVKWIRRDVQITVLQLTAWQMVCGAIVLILVNAVVPERPIELSPYYVFALAYNALLVISLAWFLWLFALQHLPAGVAGMFALASPVVSVVTGWLELGEWPQTLTLWGMLFIIVALALNSLPSTKNNTNKQRPN